MLIEDNKPTTFERFIGPTQDGLACFKVYRFRPAVIDRAAHFIAAKDSRADHDFRGVMCLLRRARNEHNSIQMAEAMRALEGSFPKRFAGLSRKPRNAGDNPVKYFARHGLTEADLAAFISARKERSCYNTTHMFDRTASDQGEPQALFLTPGGVRRSYPIYDILALGMDEGRSDSPELQRGAEAVHAELAVQAQRPQLVLSFKPRALGR